jgi:hypothetical protein
MTELSPTSAPSLTAEDLQKVFNVSARTVTSWKKQIRHFQKGRVLRFAPDAVLEFIARNSITPRRSVTICVADSVVLKQVRVLLSLCGNGRMDNAPGTPGSEGSSPSSRINFLTERQHENTTR